MGDINVAVMEGFKQDGYVLSKLRVRQKGEERIIHHYWFDSWPDHGVPKNLTTVWNMLKAVRNFSNSSEHPWVVHCSAGIGRTGTFLAIDQGIQQLHSTGVADVITIIRKLREDRGGMVQHLDQAEFVHRVLVKYAETYGAPEESHESLMGEQQENGVLQASIEKALTSVPPGFTEHPSQIDTHEGAEVCIYSGMNIKVIQYRRE